MGLDGLSEITRITQQRLLQVKEDTLITQQQVWELEHLTKEEERCTSDVQGRRKQVQTLATAALAPSAPRNGRPVDVLIQSYQALVAALKEQIDESVVQQGLMTAQQQMEHSEQRCAHLARENERLSFEHTQQRESLGEQRLGLEYAQAVSEMMLAELKKQHSKCELLERLEGELGDALEQNKRKLKLAQASSSSFREQQRASALLRYRGLSESMATLAAQESYRNDRLKGLELAAATRSREHGMEQQRMHAQRGAVSLHTQSLRSEIKDTGERLQQASELFSKHIVEIGRMRKVEERHLEEAEASHERVCFRTDGVHSFTNREPSPAPPKAFKDPTGVVGTMEWDGMAHHLSASITRDFFEQVALTGLQTETSALDMAVAHAVEEETRMRAEAQELRAQVPLHLSVC
jgi:regulator of replication initiation timing